MKKLFKIILCVLFVNLCTIMLVACNVEQKDSQNDTFTLIKDYVITYGTYDYENYEYDIDISTDYSSDYLTTYKTYLTYDTSSHIIEFNLFVNKYNGMSYIVSFEIDKIDGVYDWYYVDSYENYMSGTLYSSTWESGDLLGYSSKYLIDDSLSSSIRSLASSSINVILLNIDKNLASKRITVYDLGFVMF